MCSHACPSLYQQCYEILFKGIESPHYGHKGGKFEYTEHDTPYLAQDSSHYIEYQIINFIYDKTEDELILVTKNVGY